MPINVIMCIIAGNYGALLIPSPKNAQRKKEKIRVVGGYIYYIIIIIIIFITIPIHRQPLCNHKKRNYTKSLPNNLLLNQMRKPAPALGLRPQLVH